jgi:hypothetical protein
MQKAANALKSGDFFLLSYSGHGGQLPDVGGDEEEGLDETWCLFDGQLIDDELDYLFSRFKSGVRIFVLSDSCHSGTVTKQIVTAAYYKLNNAEVTDTRYRNMPGELCLRVYMDNKNFYDKVAADVDKKLRSATVSGSVILISGCQDSQLSSDGAFNGAFTGALKVAWAGGGFKGNYAQFKDVIVRKINRPDQVPNLYLTGATNLGFEAQVPFTI